MRREYTLMESSSVHQLVQLHQHTYTFVIITRHQAISSPGVSKHRLYTSTRWLSCHPTMIKLVSVRFHHPKATT